MSSLEEKLTKGNILDPKLLLQFAQDKTENGRGRLANAVSEVFDREELSEAEERLAGSILLNLVRQAELDLRAALAERLSVQKNIPCEIIVFLANDEISVARTVLVNSPVLTEVDLVQIIAGRGEDHWRYIAERAQLTSVVAERLVDTGDIQTVMNLVDNQRVTLGKNCLKKMIKVSLRSENLQAPLLRRSEIDGELASDLYMCVSYGLQQEIAKRFRLPLADIEAALDTLVEELSCEALKVQQVTPEMRALAKRFKERAAASPDMMIKTLRRGQISFFIALFAAKTGLTSDAVVRLIQKEGGKPFVMACRSMGMMKSEFASIFLLSRGIRSGDKIVDQRELAMALKHYDAVKEFDVQRIMKTWVNNPEMI